MVDKKQNPKPGKVLVTGVDFLVERGGSGSAKITSRADPFFNEFKSLADLIEFETKGSKSIKTINHENISLVTQAIEALPALEREFIRIYYFQGMGIDEMAMKSGIVRSRLFYIKKKATARLKIELEKLTGKKPGSIFKDCVICNSNIRDDVNRFILKWLEERNWHFRGILKALKDEFNIYASSLNVIVAHVRFHMNVDKKEVMNKLSQKYILNPTSVSDKGEGPRVNLNVPISLSIKKEIEKLAADHGRNVSEIVRLLVRMSLHPLRVMLESQEALYSEALNISKELCKIKNIEDIGYD